MVWWKVVLAVIGVIIALACAALSLIFAIAAIKDWIYGRKYPDWKDRGGRKP